MGRAAFLSLIVLCAPGGLSAQAAVSLSATVDADSVRVGEAFTVRLVVGQERPGEIQFPALIEPTAALEQIGPVQIRSMEGGREWQAEYTLVAWTADTVAIPAIEVELTGAGGVTRTLEPPAVLVRSVLPAESESLELRDARPFLRVRGFPWWTLALLAAVAALGWWTWRRRHAVAGEPPLPSGPGHLALREFDRLRSNWIDGRLTGDRFYDDYEATLRRYASATRGLAPSQGLWGFGTRDTGLLTALRHSLLARFARLRTDREGPLEDIDVGAAFVRSEMPEPEADPSEVVAVEADPTEAVPSEAVPSEHPRAPQGSDA